MADTYHYQKEFEGQKEVMESFCDRVDGDFTGEDDRNPGDASGALSGRAVHCEVDGARFSLDWDGGWQSSVPIGDDREYEDFINSRSKRVDTKIDRMRIRAPYLQIRSEDGTSRTVTMTVEGANSPVF